MRRTPKDNGTPYRHPRMPVLAPRPSRVRRLSTTGRNRFAQPGRQVQVQSRFRKGRGR
jgi:hypothetical protein